MSSSVSTCICATCPMPNAAHPPAAPPQHARHQAPMPNAACPLGPRGPGSLGCVSVPVVLSCWAEIPPAHPPAPAAHAHARAGCLGLLGVFFWWEFVALSCRGESYVCDLGLVTAVGPFSGLLVHPGRCSVAYPAGRRRKKTKEGARKVTAVGFKRAGRQKKCA